MAHVVAEVHQQHAEACLGPQEPRTGVSTLQAALGLAARALAAVSALERANEVLRAAWEEDLAALQDAEQRLRALEADYARLQRLNDQITQTIRTYLGESL